MIPADVLAEQLALVTHIDTLVARDIVRVWQSLSPESRLSTALIPDLISLVTEIATAYGEISGVAAADFYDYMVALAGTRLPAAVPVDPTLPREQVEKLVVWATAPLRFAEPLPDIAQQRVIGMTQRLAHQPGDLTTYRMCARDGVRWARVPQGKTCAWCMMLASRGAVYVSEETARRSTPRRHTHCDCAVIPVPRDDDLPGINRELHDEWQQATRGERNQLQAWRAYVRETYPGEVH